MTIWGTGRTVESSGTPDLMSNRKTVIHQTWYIKSSRSMDAGLVVGLVAGLVGGPVEGLATLGAHLVSSGERSANEL